MCDFHSIIIDANGCTYHLPENSHSGIARHFGLSNGVENRQYFECEWDGRGSMPVNLVRKGYGTETAIPSVVERTAERHYAKLQAILNGESDLVAPFDGEHYADVRERYDELQARKRVQPLIDEMAEMTDGSAVAMIRALIEELSLDMEEIAKDEIESAVESATEDLYTWDSAVDAVLGNGDYVSSDDVQAQIDEAVESATEDLFTEDQMEEAREESYVKGFNDAKNGCQPEPEYINGLPSFLFKG